MNGSRKARLIVAALVLGGYAIQAFVSETPPTTEDYRDGCVVDERSDCAKRCLTEHNCCIKSCNWVEAKAKSKCIKHCKSILKTCYRECGEKAAADKATPSPPQPEPR
jgi:hypothetical protein